MKLSIDILAHNEANSLPILLSTLCQQSLLKIQNQEKKIEIIVVLNGCIDNTDAAARNTLEQLTIQSYRISWTWKVCEVSEAGKSNAWNLFVHQSASVASDFFCLMDADIQLHDSFALEKMLDVLRKRPEYWIALDRPIKDV
ncbi:MAG: glycosyltransferase family A protein [Cyanobacteria bacterium J06623_7]